MELKASTSPKDLLKRKPDDRKIQGHFKFGFKSIDLDKVLSHLKANNVDVPQVWKDDKTGKGNFLISDPDGSLIQFFDWSAFLAS